MKKEIRFSSSIDTKEFDRAIENMQRKLQQIYQKSDESKSILGTRQAASQVGLGRPVTSQEQGRVDVQDREKRRELDKFINQQIKHQETLNQRLNKQIEYQKELNKLAKEGVDVSERQARVDRMMNTTRERINASTGAVNQALNDRMLPGFNGVGGMSGAMQRAFANYRIGISQGMGMPGAIGYGMGGFGAGVGSYAMANPTQFVGGAMGLVGGGLNLAGGAYGMMAQHPTQLLQAQGSAIGTNANAARNVLSGNYLREMVFSSARNRGQQLASEQMQNKETADMLKVMGGAGMMAGGATGMLTTGWTGIGGLISGGAMLGGMNQMLGGGRADLTMGAFLPGRLGKEAMERYRANLASEQAQLAERNTQAIMASSPMLEAIIPKFQERAMANRPLQRALGLSDEGIEGRLRLGRAGGFADDTTRNMMTQALAAGGGTAVSGNLSTFMASLERGGMGNAAGLVGRIGSLTNRGQMNDPETAKNATIRIMAEAVAKGLDQSEFRDEQNKFYQAAVDIAASRGVMTEAGIGQAARDLGAGMTEMTGRGIKGAQQAAGFMDQLSTAGGARGAIRMASVMRDPNLKGMSPLDMNLLDTMTYGQISSGDPAAEGLIEDLTEKRLKENPNLDRNQVREQVKQGLLKSKREGMVTSSQGESALQNLAKVGFGDQSSSQFKIARTKALGALNVDTGIMNLDQVTQTSVLKRLSGAEMTEEEKAKAEEFFAKTKGQPLMAGQETAGDKIERGAAAVDQLNADLISKFNDQLLGATTNVSEFGKKMLSIVDEIEKKVKSGDYEGARSAAAQGAGLLGTQPKAGPGEQ